MPLINTRPDSPQTPEPGPIQITNPAYRGVTVDTREVPVDNILRHIGGRPWTVNYYQQVLDKDSPVTPFALTQEAINQQYRLIEKFQLRVTSALTSSEDQENQQLLTGTARMFPVLKPNVGDVFIADIGDGREGLFSVTECRRLSIFKAAVHEIEYEWIAYLTPIYYDNLAAKTVDDVVFVYDYMVSGQNPLLQPEEYNTLTDMGRQLRLICHNYFDEFVSNEYKTLIIPEQLNSCYDPYLTNAVLSFFNTFDAPKLRQVRRMNVDGDWTVKSKTIWDVLMQQNLPLFRRIGTKIALVHARSFERNPMFESIYYSGIYYVAYLTDPVLSTDAKRANAEKSPSATIVPPETFYETIPPTTPPMLPRIAETESYVFSDAFYGDRQDLSQLELEIWNYLENKAIDISRVSRMAKEFFSWGDLERFYYGPALMVLMKALLRST